MKKSFSLLLSLFTIVTALVCCTAQLFAQPGDEVRITAWPYETGDTLYVFPGQEMTIAIGAISADDLYADLLSASASPYWPCAMGFNYFSLTPMGRDGCGTLVEDYNPAGCYYRFDWSDHGDSCMIGSGRFGFLICVFSVTNTMPVGSWDAFGASVTCWVRYNDGFATFIANPLRKTVLSVEGILGDPTGDGAVTWADVDTIQYYSLYTERAPWYQLTGTNLERGRTVFSSWSPIDDDLIAYHLINPTHPWVVNLGIGGLISERPSGAVVSVPGTVEVSGSTVTVYTDGQAAMVTAWMPDGTMWRQAAFVSNGQVTFYDLPDGVTADMVTVEAIVVPSALGVEPPVLDALPNRVELSQNYPNPFNPSTQIAFDLKQAGHVSLQVFDLSGRLVSTLIQGTVPAGQHAVTFNASGLPSGCYFYRLQANGFVQSRKMVLLK